MQHIRPELREPYSDFQIVRGSVQNRLSFPKGAPILRSFQEFLSDKMRNPKFRAEHERLGPEFAIIQAMIDARKSKHRTQKRLAERTESRKRTSASPKAETQIRPSKCCAETPTKWGRRPRPNLYPSSPEGRRLNLHAKERPRSFFVVLLVPGPIIGPAGRILRRPFFYDAVRDPYAALLFHIWRGTHSFEEAQNAQSCGLAALHIWRPFFAACIWHMHSCIEIT